MLQFEIALAKAQAQHKIIPSNAAEIIEKVATSFPIDLEKLKKEIPMGGNAAIPLIKQLTQAVRNEDEEAAKYVHFGATSQDVVDTALVLQMKAFISWLNEQLQVLKNHLIQLTSKYRTTFMMGRTLMQQAKPITFGLKTALWLQSIQRSEKRLLAVGNRLLVVQLAGAAGSGNAQLTFEVKKSLANILGLNDAHSWHTGRDNLAAFAAVLGILSGSLGKIAQDIVLMSQTEVGELAEPSAKGRGASSTMPHKRNPILSTTILANTHRIPFLVATILAAIPQEHERAAGRWHAEWETLADIMKLTSGSVEKGLELVSGLEVNEMRMLQNIELTNGLIFAEKVSLALAKQMGKSQAHTLVEKACQMALSQQKVLRQVLEEMNVQLSQAELDECFSLENAIGNSLEIIDDTLDADKL